ncbi:HEPN domain-containing protein [Candidatus Pacearchaeota archaeon]|nr:HEPN domain-containing protein [Candidatus Pacearchaeota archaeon]
MEIKTIEDCLKFRLLRRISPDKHKSVKSLEMAQINLKDANVELKYSLYKSAIMSSYMAMFHAARAILYRDGIQEKNHYAVYIYLKEKYLNKIPLPILNLLNIHRIERHEAVYGLDFIPQKEDALLAVRDAKSFISEAEKVFWKET